VIRAKIKTSNFFLPKCFHAKCSVFCEHNLCLDNRGGKNKTQEKSVLD
jgi:hypothetical protein